MITRDLVQGFIDGYKASGGNPATLQDAVANWLVTHSQYPSTPEDIKKILNDLKSYKH